MLQLNMLLEGLEYFYFYEKNIIQLSGTSFLENNFLRRISGN